MENTSAPNQPPKPTPSAPGQSFMDVHSPAPQVSDRNPSPPPDHQTPAHSGEKGSPSRPNNTPKIVIAVAVIIALSLVGIAVAIYLQGRDQAEPKQETTLEQTSVQPATTDDVDETTQTVDEALKETDIAEELPEDDLSNQTLGL